jgi:dTDP-4-dehydrorhamnose reductase
MKILIAGSGGILGKHLTQKLSNKNISVKKLSRYEIDDFYFEYGKTNPNFPVFNEKFDAIINCAYVYKDICVNDSNINILINRNLIKLSRINNISLYINISSISSFDNCVSSYGKIKRLIEKDVKCISGYTFRLGLFETFDYIGLIKKFNTMFKYMPFSVGIKKKDIFQYITDLDKFDNFIYQFLIKKNYKPGIYSVVNSKPIHFNDLIYAITNKKPVKISHKLILLILKFYEFLPLPYIRFNSDSFISLMNGPKKINKIINLESF